MSYSQGSSKQRTEMGSIGTAVTGAAFNHDWHDHNGMSFEVHCPNNPLDTLTLSLAPSNKFGLYIKIKSHLATPPPAEVRGRNFVGECDRACADMAEL